MTDDEIRRFYETTPEAERLSTGPFQLEFERTKEFWLKGSRNRRPPFSTSAEGPAHMPSGLQTWDTKLILSIRSRVWSRKPSNEVMRGPTASLRAASVTHAHSSGVMLQLMGFSNWVRSITSFIAKIVYRR